MTFATCVFASSRHEPSAPYSAPMQTAQPYQRTLDFFATRNWSPRMAGEPRMWIVSAGQSAICRAALDIALALGYRAGTRVRDSDATLILTLGAFDGGATMAAQAASRAGKPCLMVDLDAADAIESVRAWLREIAPGVLNIAGPRESKRPGVYGRAYSFLSRVLKRSH